MPKDKGFDFSFLHEPQERTLNTILTCIDDIKNAATFYEDYNVNDDSVLRYVEEQSFELAKTILQTDAFSTNQPYKTPYAFHERKVTSGKLKGTLVYRGGFFLLQSYDNRDDWKEINQSFKVLFNPFNETSFYGSFPEQFDIVQLISLSDILVDSTGNFYIHRFAQLAKTDEGAFIGSYQHMTTKKQTVLQNSIRRAMLEDPLPAEFGSIVGRRIFYFGFNQRPFDADFFPA